MIKTPHVMGLDISATNTGCVVMEPHHPDNHTKCFQFNSKKKGLERASDQAEQMLEVLGMYKPEVVVIEDYGYANAHSLATIVEVSTILRYFLLQTGHPFHLCAPNALKKFVIGKGSGKKDIMRLEIYKKWGFEHSSHDVVDAYGLARVAQAIYLMTKTTENFEIHKYQIEVLKTILAEK